MVESYGFEVRRGLDLSGPDHTGRQGRQMDRKLASAQPAIFKIAQHFLDKDFRAFPPWQSPSQSCVRPIMSRVTPSQFLGFRSLFQLASNSVLYQPDLF